MPKAKPEKQRKAHDEKRSKKTECGVGNPRWQLHE
jgi:hypothetical protein